MSAGLADEVSTVRVVLGEHNRAIQLVKQLTEAARLQESMHPVVSQHELRSLHDCWRFHEGVDHLVVVHRQLDVVLREHHLPVERTC